MSIFTAAAYAQFAAKCRRNTGESAATGTNESTLSFMAPPSSPSSSGSTTPESKDPPESYFLDVKITPLDNLVRRPNPKIPFREPPWGPPGFLYPVRRQAPNQRELERLFLHRTQKPGLYDFTELPPLHRHKMYAEIYDTNALYGGTDEPTMAQRITAAKIAKHKKEFDELMMSRDLFAHGPACRADRVSALRQRMAEEDREKRTRADTSRELKESDLFSPITPEVIQKRKEEDRVHRQLVAQEAERKMKSRLELIDKEEQEERKKRRTQEAKYDKKEKKKQEKRYRSEKKPAHAAQKQINGGQTEDYEMSDDEAEAEEDEREDEETEDGEVGDGPVKIIDWLLNFVRD